MVIFSVLNVVVCTCIRCRSRLFRMDVKRPGGKVGVSTHVHLHLKESPARTSALRVSSRCSADVFFVLSKKADDTHPPGHRLRRTSRRKRGRQVQRQCKIKIKSCTLRCCFYTFQYYNIKFSRIKAICNDKLHVWIVRKEKINSHNFLFL